MESSQPERPYFNAAYKVSITVEGFADAGQPLEVLLTPKTVEDSVSLDHVALLNEHQNNFGRIACISVENSLCFTATIQPDVLREWMNGGFELKP